MIKKFTPIFLLLALPAEATPPPLAADQIQMGQVSATTIPIGKTGQYSPSGGGNAGLPVWRKADGTDVSMVGGNAFYQTVELNTAPLTQQPALNFSTVFNVTNNAGNSSTDVTVANGGITNAMLANSQITVSSGTGISVAGSPVSLGGTVTITNTLATNSQTANTIFAGPTSGGAAAPTFRALVAADLPAGTGTVTSVALALPVSVFTISGSPVTTSGTLTGSFANQTANTVFAGPTSGGATTPAFRALVAADLPSGTITGSITSGQVGFGSVSNTLTSSSKLTWDDTNSRFKIGTVGPTTYTAQVVGTNANNDLIAIENTDNTKYSAIAFFDSAGTGQTAIGWGNSATADVQARNRWNFFQGTNDVIFNRGNPNSSLFLKGSNGFVGVNNASPNFQLDVVGTINTSSNYAGAQTSTSAAASNIGVCRFNTSNHWECSENNGSYFQVILATTTSDITWTSAANHSLSMQAAATDTAGINFTITSGAAGTVSASGGKAGGTLNLNGAAGVAGTAGLAAGAGGSVAITTGSGGTNGGGGGATNGGFTITLGTATGVAVPTAMQLTGASVAATGGPLLITGNSFSNIGPQVTLDAATNNGGRKWSLVSSGSSAGCGTGKLCFLDTTGGTYRFAIDSSGNFGNVGANGFGMSISMNNNGTAPPASIYTIGGNIEVDTIPTPGLPTITVNGAAGATTCTYYLVGTDRYGNLTLPGSPRSVANCNATLDSSNNNTVQTSASTNLNTYQYKIIRSAGGPNQGLIATVNASVTTNTVDNGISASAWTDPVYNATGDLVLDGTNGKGSVRAARLVSVGSTPTNTPGTGAGTGPTVTITGNDQAGTLSVLTGTGPSASAIVVTITFNQPYATGTGVTGAAPKSVCLQPTNTAAAALSGNAQVYTSALNATNWVLSVGSTNLAATTTYTWTYHVTW